MKTIKFLSVVLFCLVCTGTILFTSGCSMMQKNPVSGSPCMGIEPGASKICEITGNPQDLSFLLKLANAAAIKKDLYKANQALAVVDKLTTVLEKGITYKGLMELLGKEVDPVLFVVISEYQDRFMALNIPILPYDMELILLHLSKQREIILMSIKAPLTEADLPGGTNGLDESSDLARGGAGLFRPETECKGGAGPYRPNCGGIDGLSFADPVITGTNGPIRFSTGSFMLASGDCGP